MQKIIPHLWFDKEAAEASQFYMSLFKDSKLINKTVLTNTPSGTVDLLTISLEGQEFMLISAGPYFKFTPAVSFLVSCGTQDEVEFLYQKFTEGGYTLMELDSYPFSKKYAWVMDKYGLSWQIMYTEDTQLKQKFTPTLMFVGEQCGKAEEAIRFYTSLFKDSKVDFIQRYEEGSLPDKPGTIQHAQFTLANQGFAAMDSAYEHGFTFNEAISFVVNCDSQAELDYYWEKLSAVPEAEQCGWLKDKYGLSWQITPSIMNDMMKTADSKKLAQVTEAFLNMKKFDIAKLLEAYEK
jgi:predicted 3-demethylubiquinone-9 3-methyltransferase (glyoxalase superfamily)